MKKVIFASLIVILITAISFMPALAKTKVVKGQVTAVDSGANTITVLTNRGETIVLIAPANFDFTSISVGDSIIAKGELQNDGTFGAEWIKPVGRDQKDTDEDKPEGDKSNSAFCDPTKKDKP